MSMPGVVPGKKCWVGLRVFDAVKGSGAHISSQGNDLVDEAGYAQLLKHPREDSKMLNHIQCHSLIHAKSPFTEP